MKTRNVMYLFLLVVALMASSCVGYGYRPNYYAAPRYYAPRPYVRVVSPPVYFRPPAYCPPPRSYGYGHRGYGRGGGRRRW